MTQAKEGDKVKVHYEGSLDDGTIFESTFEKEPIEVTLGEEKLIPGFENAVLGMSEGDTRNVTVGPEEGFGTRKNDLVVDVDRAEIPEHIDPQEGMMLQIRSEEGNIRYFTIADVSETTVTLDGNHPLAGRDINFKIQLLEVL